jgi:hypothetical protein
MNTSEVALHSKMLHKPQTHCSPNLFADVLNNRDMYTIRFSKKLKYCILRNTRSKVKFEDLEYKNVLYILMQ